MDSQITDAVTEWETVPFAGGYDGLQELADDEFTGAVTAGTAWGFMLNGRLIGIVDGSLPDFEAAEGTAYEAPDPSLPLLYTMQEGDSEEQAEYYTKDTPIAEADETLSEGNFTGFIELSKNVHSGDYYIVYYGGRSMSVAFVGNSRRLLTEDEAYDRANDEIGIYNVYAADIDVIDIPETDSGAGSDAAADTEAADDDTTETGTDIPDADAVDPTGASATPSSTGSTDNSDSTATTGSDPTDGTTPEPASNGGTTAGDDTTATADTGSTTPSSTADSSTDSSLGTESVDIPDAATSGSESTSADTTTQPSPDNSATAGRSDSDGSPFSEEAEWRNTTTIPSLDPSDDGNRKQRGGGGQQAQQQRRQQQENGGTQLSRQQLTQRLQQAEEVMEKAENRHQELLEERDAAIEERDAAREERDTAREEIDALESELAEARAKIEELEEQLAAAEEPAEPTPAAATESAAQTGQTLDPASALEGTSLFVRYDSKGASTLQTAHDQGVDPNEVNENLRLEHHTTFETDGLTVDGEPYEAFLEDRIEFAFADWLVRDLLFEIQATGTQAGMRGIYDAIPKIDRIELRGTVDLGTDEDDEPITHDFDLITRDKHGNPLFVANFDESNQPVSPEPVEGLIESGSEIRGREKHFIAGFGVTTSYFSPEALDAAESATGSGLLSRSKKKSYVSLSRKRGYHLCLVDRIDDGFDLRVPEL
ncbi:hypothetical protein EGH24_09985 [Halonotius terrestris]|uniref:DUF7527 domain-containing protein n=1 Tax=Halonotius terrestris TaxID=2487750 RepID=A0A8J8P8K5_9EURY|nr:hypothetical protein [Halonotius terrestris]TQQ79813.1 hypothetical protein EGH24_09985 [Halonotius terrestris]